MAYDKQVTIRLNEEVLKKVDEVGKEKYRGIKNRNLIFRLMIEDAWKELECIRVGVR